MTHGDSGKLAFSLLSVTNMDNGTKKGDKGLPLKRTEVFLTHLSTRIRSVAIVTRLLLDMVILRNVRLKTAV